MKKKLLIILLVSVMSYAENNITIEAYEDNNITSNLNSENTIVKEAIRENEIHSSNTKVVPLWTKSYEIFAGACENQEMDGCYELGVLYGEGKGVDKNITKANELWAKACDAGHAEGCFKLGTSYQRGRGVKRDSTVSRRLFAKSCNNGSIEGCFSLGNLLNGVQGNTIKDRRTANPFFKKACDGGIGEACITYVPGLSSVVSSNEKSNKITTAERQISTKRGLKYIKKACDLGYAIACYMYADHLETSDTYYKPIPELLDKKLRYMVKACDGGYEAACEYAGTVYLEKSWVDGSYRDGADKKKAKMFFEKSCSFRSYSSCKRLKEVF